METRSILMAVGILAILGGVAYLIAKRSQKKGGELPPVVPPKDQPPAVVAAPRLPKGTRVGDCGYPQQPRGFVDVNKTGVRNSFCRVVGNGDRWVCDAPDGKSQILNEVFTNQGDLPMDAYAPGYFVGWNCCVDNSCQ